MISRLQINLRRTALPDSIDSRTVVGSDQPRTPISPYTPRSPYTPASAKFPFPYDPSQETRGTSTFLDMEPEKEGAKFLSLGNLGEDIVDWTTEKAKPSRRIVHNLDILDDDTELMDLSPISPETPTKLRPKSPVLRHHF